MGRQFGLAFFTVLKLQSISISTLISHRIYWTPQKRYIPKALPNPYCTILTSANLDLLTQGLGIKLQQHYLI